MTSMKVCLGGLGGLGGGFSAFHGRQPADPVKVERAMVRVLARDEGLGVSAVLPVWRDVFVRMEERRARAMGEVEGLKVVAGYDIYTV